MSEGKKMLLFGFVIGMTLLLLISFIDISIQFIKESSVPNLIFLNLIAIAFWFGIFLGVTIDIIIFKIKAK